MGHVTAFIRSIRMLGGGASRVPARAAAVEGQLRGAAGPSGAAGAPVPCRAALNINQELNISQQVINQ